MHAESAEQLDQDSTYLLVVTRGVHDANGEPLDTTTFRHDLNFGQTKDPATKAYRKALIDALDSAFVAGVHNDDIAAASLFTTQSITAISQKIRDQIRSAAAPQANFNIATGGARAVFANSPTLQIRLNRQNSVAGPLTTSTLNPGILFLPTNFPGSVGTIAYGSFPSPNYEDASQAFPPVGTRTGVPAVQRVENLVFTLFVPSGTAPAGGWPVAIFGHGFTDSMNGAPWAVAASLARAHIATIAINVVGHGGGSASTFTVSRPGLPTLTLPAGGRGIDQDHNGTIDSTEGVNAANGSIVSNRDGLRQTVIDLVSADAHAAGRRRRRRRRHARPEHLSDLLLRPVVRRHLRRRAARSRVDDPRRRPERRRRPDRRDRPTLAELPRPRRAVAARARRSTTPRPSTASTSTRTCRSRASRSWSTR